MDMDTAQAIMIWITTVITAASVIVKGVSMITGITPSTRDDEIVTRAQAWLAKAQNVLGAISLDASKQAKK